MPGGAAAATLPDQPVATLVSKAPPTLSEAAAAGYPLTVSLRVPLWLVNATPLLISCALLALWEAPPASAARLGEAVSGVAGAWRVRAAPC